MKWSGWSVLVVLLVSNDGVAKRTARHRAFSLIFHFQHRQCGLRLEIILYKRLSCECVRMEFTSHALLIFVSCRRKHSFLLAMGIILERGCATYVSSWTSMKMNVLPFTVTAIPNARLLRLVCVRVTIPISVWCVHIRTWTHMLNVWMYEYRRILKYKRRRKRMRRRTRENKFMGISSNFN